MTRLHIGWVSPWFVLTLLGLSLSLNVYMGSTWRPVVVVKPRFTVGMSMPPLRADQVGGASTTIDWADPSDHRPTLLYVFTPPCVWCMRNLANIQALSAARQSEYRFIGLSLSAVGVAEYLKTSPLGFPVYTKATEPNGKSVEIAGTPQTLLISYGGRVEKAWVGAYSGKIKTEIETTLNVRLPGLPPNQASRQTQK